MNDYEYTELRRILDNAQRIVFFGGAGVSTESGIPDFRSASGLYADKEADVSPEEILTPRYLYWHSEQFYDYYKREMVHPDAMPNDAHYALARLEAEGKLIAVITQNIDGLHQAAGSENVIELHGSVHRNHCTECGKKFDLNAVLAAPGVPNCDRCGGLIRPDVVLYHEGLRGDDFAAAEEAISQADVLIVGGTSLTVYPAAGLIDYFDGDYLILLNQTPTSADGGADFILREPIGEVFAQLMDD